ncbi:MAG: hypothetical protein Kow0040_09080 [Thermogutta sp.]
MNPPSGGATGVAPAPPKSVPVGPAYGVGEAIRMVSVALPDDGNVAVPPLPTPCGIDAVRGKFRGVVAQAESACGGRAYGAA